MTEAAMKMRFSRIESKVDALTEAVSKLLERIERSEDREELLTIGAAADALGISVRALRERAKRGTVNCHYNDGHYFFDADYIASLPKAKA